MDDKKLFSQYYSKDTTRYEDKEKFRNRVSMYLEDFVNVNFPENIRLKCRSKMGLDIEKILTLDFKKEYRYAVENLFYKRPVGVILDFM